MFTYQEAKDYLIKNLSQDAEAHLSGDFSSIGDNFDRFDANLPRNGDPRFKKLFVGLNFWDGWQDARNHDWHFYEGIRKRDWPEFAQILISDIRADREITNKVILQHFDIQPRKGILSRIKALISSKLRA